YGDIWYVVSKVFVCLQLEVPQNLNIICFKDFLHLVFPPIVGCWFAVLLTQVPVAALWQPCHASLCSLSGQSCYRHSLDGELFHPWCCTVGIFYCPLFHLFDI